MNPEDKELLERTLRLSVENNQILHKMQKVARWTFIWGFIKFLLLIVPLIIGFVLLQPYFEPMQNMFESFRALVNFSR